MNIAQIRLENARSLSNRCHGITAFAEKLGKGQSQISSLIGINPTKNIGNKIAREIEVAFGLPHGWMDVRHVPSITEIERVDFALRQKGVDWTWLARQLGIDIYVAKGWKDRGQLPSGLRSAIADAIDETTEWLESGNINTELYRVVHFGKDKDNVSPGPEVGGGIPLISWVQAGYWAEAEDQFAPGDAEGFMPCPTSHGPHSFALRVEGDSMTSPHGKSYPNGCIIYVDPDQRGGVVSGDRVIAKLNGENAVTFKVFVEDAGRRFLKPLNTQYPPITDEFRILGKVIGKWEDE